MRRISADLHQREISESGLSKWPRRRYVCVDVGAAGDEHGDVVRLDELGGGGESGSGRQLGIDLPATRKQFSVADVNIVEITPPVLGDATTVPPARLRTLDAIHLATALDLGASADILLTYDRALTGAARHRSHRDFPGAPY